MNHKTKIATGTSAAGVLLLLFNFWHLGQAFKTIGENDKNDVFKNASVTIILTDSTGKKDTMLMEDYLKTGKYK